MRILQELHKKGGVLSLPFCCQTPHPPPPPPPPQKNIQTKTLRSGVSPNYTCNTWSRYEICWVMIILSISEMKKKHNNFITDYPFSFNSFHHTKRLVACSTCPPLYSRRDFLFNLAMARRPFKSPAFTRRPLCVVFDQRRSKSAHVLLRSCGRLASGQQSGCVSIQH